jgi:hypothetical protein
LVKLRFGAPEALQPTCAARLALFTRSSLVGVATLGSLYLGLEIHGIPQAFAAATAAQIGIMVVLAIASRAVPHRDPPRNQSSGPTRPVPIPTAMSGAVLNVAIFRLSSRCRNKPPASHPYGGRGLIFMIPGLIGSALQTRCG